MADPLSVAASVAGFLSLAISTTKGLHDYYVACRDMKSDVALTIRKIARLLDMLENLGRQTNARKVQDGDRDLIANIESVIKDCEEATNDLNGELQKLNKESQEGKLTSIRVAGRRLAYPFRQSTLQKLEEDMDDLMLCLSPALQLLQQNDIGKVLDGVDDTRALLALVRANQVSHEIREWLKAPDATINFNENARKKHPGTGVWLVESLTFETWLKEASSFLWLVGFAGCGKSVLSSTVIQHVYRYRGDNSRIGLAFFFFTFTDENKQDLSAMLRAIILQLSSQLGDKSVILKPWYDSHGGASATDAALLDCLRLLVREFDDTYIVLDALDESPREKHREALVDALAEMRGWHEPTLHLAISSRDEFDIREGLEVSPENTVQLRNEGIDQDVASFVSQHLQENRRLRKWKDHHDRIEKVLTERSGGVFRWVECQLKDLANCGQSEDLLDRRLESLPTSLGETYQRMLCNLPSMSRDYARQMLTILCCAHRPLTVEELVDGAAVQFGNPPMYNPKRRLKGVYSIQEVCPGFIEFYPADDTGEPTAYIAHFSVREYLESEEILQHEGSAFFIVRPKEADSMVARVCLSILLDPELVKPREGRSQGHWSQESVVRPGLARYAAHNWSKHFLDGSDNPQAELMILQLLTSKVGCFDNWIYLMGLSYAPPSPLYYASMLGLASIVPLFLDKNLLAPFLFTRREFQTTPFDLLTESPNKEHTGTQTALFAASAHGHAEIVQILLANGADPDTISYGVRDFSTALAIASRHGRKDIVRMLIEQNADVNLAREGLSPLIAALEYGKIDIVKLLIEAGVKVNMYPTYPRFRSAETALETASRLGYTGVVQLLIDNGADVQIFGKSQPALTLAIDWNRLETVRVLLRAGFDVNRVGPIALQTALKRASQKGRSSIVQLIIDHGASVNSIPEIGESALVRAAYGRHKKVVEQLLEAGVDANACDYLMGTALSAASRAGSAKIVQILIDNGADVNASSSTGLSALSTALKAGKAEIAQILIDSGADVKACDLSIGSALSAASETGNARLVQMLIDDGAHVNGNETTSHAMAMAASNGHNDIIRLLLAAGADVNGLHPRFGTALRAASRFGVTSTAQLLIDKGADVNLNADGETPLYTAVQGGNTAVVRLLINNGADVNVWPEKSRERTILQEAVYQGNESLIQRLINNGADVNAYGPEFGSALLAAIHKGRDENTIRLLIDSGADVNAYHSHFGSALRVAVQRGSDEKTIRLLIDSGADVDMRSLGHKTILQEAVTHADEKVVQLLIDSGASINAYQPLVGSALHDAVSRVNGGKIVQLLIDNGADVNTHRLELVEALQQALRFGGRFEEIGPLLVDHGVDLSGVDIDGTRDYYDETHEPDRERHEEIIW